MHGGALFKKKQVITFMLIARKKDITYNLIQNQYGS